MDKTRKRMIQQTSLQVWNELQPKLSACQERVYSILRQSEQALTNSEIAARLGLSINNITPRCLELRNKSLVCNVGVRVCSVTGNKAMVWRVSSIQQPAV